MQTELTRWDPFRSFGLLPGFFSRELPEADFLHGTERSAALTGTWVPPVDIAEDAERITLTAELPGFREDQVEIQVDSSMLTLRGEREFRRNGNGSGERNYHRVERSYGQFVRTFSLPNAVDASAATARFENGLLTVELPKRQEARPRQIPIGSSNGGRRDSAER
jgi:HSP20 family protein